MLIIAAIKCANAWSSAVRKITNVIRNVTKNVASVRFKTFALFHVVTTYSQNAELMTKTSYAGNIYLFLWSFYTIILIFKWYDIFTGKLSRKQSPIVATQFNLLVTSSRSAKSVKSRVICYFRVDTLAENSVHWNALQKTVRISSRLLQSICVDIQFWKSVIPLIIMVNI